MIRMTQTQVGILCFLVTDPLPESARWTGNWAIWVNLDSPVLLDIYVTHVQREKGRVVNPSRTWACRKYGKSLITASGNRYRMMVFLLKFYHWCAVIGAGAPNGPSASGDKQVRRDHVAVHGLGGGLSWDTRCRRRALDVLYINR